MDPESALIGMSLYEPNLIPEIKDRLPSPKYFESKSHRTVIKTVYELHENGDEVTPVTVAENLEGEELAGIGGASYLADLANNYSVLDANGVDTVIEEVKERHIERKSRKILMRGKEEIEDESNPIKVIQKINTELDKLQAEKVTSEITHVADSTDELFDLLEDAKENGALPGTLSTGFSEIDDRMKGISKNDFVLVSADTGVGKTSMALQIADTVADAQGRNVMIFSGEMHGWEIIMKILSKRGVATLDEMQDGEISQDQWDRLVNAVTTLKESGLYTIRESQPTIFDFKSAVRRANNEHGIDLALLDYVQMLENPSPQTMDTVEHLNMVSSELRDFTNDMDIPVLAISRENKGGEIYGSSQLKYDCNYRLVIVDPDDDTDRRLVSVEKARLAKGGAVEMYFQGENSRFVRKKDGEQSEQEPTRPF